MKAVTLKQAVNYVCQEDRKSPKEEQVTFVYQQLNAKAENLIDDATGYTEAGRSHITLGKTNSLALNIWLIEIKNLFDENGKEVKLERDETKPFIMDGIRPIKDEVLDKIPPLVRFEVSQAIKHGVELTEEETKN